MACDKSIDDDYSGDSGGGTVFAFGGGDYTFSCPSGSGGTVPIPNTSSSACVNVYQNYARVFGCNLIDDFESAQNDYNACVAQDVAACASAPASDPNC